LKRLAVSGPSTCFSVTNWLTANVNHADGYSSGEVQKVIEEVAAQSLPAGYGYEYGGMAREEASSGELFNKSIFGIQVVVIKNKGRFLYDSGGREQPAYLFA
jgi:multidrug efflux pump subunit AcrB